MIDTVYTFKKTLEELYEEYQNILLDACGNEVEQVWKSYLEPVLETVGWKARWLIPPALCEFFNILYPEYVLVTVTDVDFETLTATVDIKEDLPHCELPDSIIEVALSDLIALTDQDPTIALSMMDITAVYLNQYHVFKRHLWWPWDEEEEHVVWADVHLRNRLQLYFEMMEGKIPLKIGSLIKDLITEGKTKHEAIARLVKLPEAESPEVTKELMDLCVHLKAIKEKLLFYSDFDTRRKIEVVESETPIIWTHYLVVKPGTSGKDTAELLNALPQSPELPLNIGSDLHVAIKSLTTNNSLYLSPGTWSLNSVGMLELGGSLQGVYTSKERLPVIEDVGFARASWLHFHSNEAKLSNLNLNVLHKYAVTVGRNATLTLTNVRLTGEGLQNGLYLKSGSTLVAEDCEFESLNTVLLVMSGARVTLKKCTFNGNATALAVSNSHITLIGCTFKQCASHALLVRNVTCAAASVAALNETESFQIEDCEFEKNGTDVELR